MILSLCIVKYSVKEISIIDDYFAVNFRLSSFMFIHIIDFLVFKRIAHRQLSLSSFRC